MKQKIGQLLEAKFEKYNQPEFIESDPISIPHLFSKKQDIEIMGFWISILSWGQRSSIINSGKKLIELMDGAPHDFILNHQETDLKKFENFKHRTFQFPDTLYFLEFLKFHYSNHSSLEDAFLPGNFSKFENTENHLNHFYQYFFSLEYYLNRTKKHIASPNKNSACKRLNMYLRWMVRKDSNGVDFGLWNNIRPDQLVCPLDVHVHRVAAEFKLVSQGPTNWKMAVELTNNLKRLDPSDPVKYDFALFSLGIYENF